jgi:hypothetical protein
MELKNRRLSRKQKRDKWTDMRKENLCLLICPTEGNSISFALWGQGVIRSNLRWRNIYTKFHEKFVYRFKTYLIIHTRTQRQGHGDIMSLYFVMECKTPFNPFGAWTTVYTTRFNIKIHYILPAQGIYIFRMVLTINSDCCSKQYCDT